MSTWFLPIKKQQHLIPLVITLHLSNHSKSECLVANTILDYFDLLGQHMFQIMTTMCCCYMGKRSLYYHILINELKTPTWVKVFRINPEFMILRLTFHRKLASKC